MKLQSRMRYIAFLRTQTRCLEENDEKHERERKIKMKKANREATIGIPEEDNFWTFRENFGEIKQHSRGGRAETSGRWIYGDNVC